jgi:branched-chain amino acid transport system substrate-binding protein
MKRTILWSSVAFALAASPFAAAAQTAVKIGVLADMSGPYSDFAGPGSVEAVKMAAEDFRAANQSLAIEPPTGKTSRTLPPRLRGAGSTLRK